MFPPYLYFRFSRNLLFLAPYKYVFVIFVAIFLKKYPQIFVKFSVYVQL